MKSSSALLFGATMLGVALAFDPPHPCSAFPIKVSKLQNCATASAFCSSYLGGPGSFTRTSTRTKTITPTSTVYNTESTTTSVLSEATTTVAPTSTMTASQLTYCQTIPTVGAKRRAAASPSASCGIAPDADPSRVSGACNCILATKTVTVLKTTAVADTVTSTSTTVFSTTSLATTTLTQGDTVTVTTYPISTATDCVPRASAQFYLFDTRDQQFSNGGQSDGPSNVFAVLVQDMSDAGSFFLDQDGEVVVPSAGNGGGPDLYASIDQYALIEYAASYILDRDPLDYSRLIKCNIAGPFYCSTQNGPYGTFDTQGDSIVWQAYSQSGPFIAVFPSDQLILAV